MKSNYIKKIIKDIFIANNINSKYYKLDYKTPVGNGYCLDYYYKDDILISIGAKELKNPFNKEISDDILLKVIINTFHEIRHFIQQREYFSSKDIVKGDEFKTQMFFNHLACIGSYYGYYSIETNYGHYFNNIREIDAEYNALKNTYDYLSTIMDKEKVNKLLLDFINSKKGKIYYFDIDKEITSIKELDKIFEKTKKKALYKKNTYIINYINKDESIKYMQNINDDFILKVNDVNMSLEQDKLLAGAYIKYIEDKNIDILIRNAYCYKKHKQELLENTENILYDDNNKYHKDYIINEEIER